MTPTQCTNYPMTVRGGAGGITANYDDMVATSNLMRGYAGHLIEMAVECQRWLVDPDVAASAILDPAGSARFEEAMAVALDGPAGLTVVGGGVELRAVELIAAVTAYDVADRVERDAVVDIE